MAVSPSHSPTTEFILYACPQGDLAQQLAHYFQASQQQLGKNTAHAYMPHCTLTGFFQDDPGAVLAYQQIFAAAVDIVWGDRPSPPAHITQLTCRPDWHGLELDAPWFGAIAQAFAQHPQTPTRTAPIRLKTWLHLSLAYGFPPDHHAPLQQLAQTLIDPQAPVSWELRLYQRDRPNQWRCHAQHPL